MSLTIQIKAFERGVPDPCGQLARELTPSKLSATYGPRCKELTRNHLKNLPSNKRGWPSTKFWEGAARATTWEPRENGMIAILVDKIGVRQRYKGGPISPVKAGALTIPISPLSYGKTVKDFPYCFLLKTRKGAYIVQAEGGGTRERRRGVGGMRTTLTFLFKLVGSVNQKANPDVMPTPAEYRETIFATARERLAGIKQRRGRA